MPDVAIQCDEFKLQPEDVDGRGTRGITAKAMENFCDIAMADLLATVAQACDKLATMRRNRKQKVASFGLEETVPLHDTRFDGIREFVTQAVNCEEEFLKVMARKATEQQDAIIRLQLTTEARLAGEQKAEDEQKNVSSASNATSAETEK